MNEVNLIGWEAIESLNQIIQGSDGTQRITLTFADGSEPSSYSGWTCAFKLLSSDGREAITAEPAVDGDGSAKTLSFDLVYSAEMTADITPGFFSGNATMTLAGSPPQNYKIFNPYFLEVIGSAS